MKRREYLKTALAAGAGMAAAASRGEAQTKGNPIVLYVDMPVVPSREKEMLKNYHEVFKPAAEKFEGYIDLKIVKIQQALMGSAPGGGVNYRFQLTYQSEALRQKWIASATHQRVWPTIENTFTTKNYTVLLCDVV